MTTPLKKIGEILRQRDGVEKSLLLLRENGYSKVRSMQFLTRYAGVDLARAKEIVHFSRVWQDTRAQDEAFHEQVVQIVTELAAEESKGA